MNSELGNLKIWLVANKLSLNITKTEFMIIGSRQRLSTIDKYDLKVGVDRDQIHKVSKTKSLGLTIDENLNWKYHNDYITAQKKIASCIGALKRMRDYVTKETEILIVPLQFGMAVLKHYVKNNKNYRIGRPVLLPARLMIFPLVLFLTNSTGIHCLLFI